MRCPLHKNTRMNKSNWSPPHGLDPLMTRHACIECPDYWYKSPKKVLRRWEEVCRQEGFVDQEVGIPDPKTDDLTYSRMAAANAP